MDVVTTSVLSNEFILKQNKLIEGTNISISGEVISTVDVVTTNDLSNVLILKQNKLIEGTNISISDEVISTMDIVTTNDLSNAFTTKQNKLIEGTNITISDEVISTVDVVTTSDLSNVLILKQNKLVEGTNISISDEVISTVDVVTTNDLSNVLILKQNKLIEGTNISISGDVINISGDIVHTIDFTSAFTTKQNSLSEGNHIIINNNVISTTDIVNRSDLSGAFTTKQNKLMEGTNISISGDIISTVDLVTTNDLSNSLALKQDNLSAGTNISISGDVISSIGEESGGSNIFISYQDDYYYDESSLGIGTKDICNNYALTVSGGIYTIGTHPQQSIKIEDNNITTSGNVIVGGELTISGEILYNIIDNIIDNKIGDPSNNESTNQMKEGSIVNVSYRNYDKFVTSNVDAWNDIDNNIVDGYVVSFIPKSSNSKLLVHCNMHIGLYSSPRYLHKDGRWWGARLYRKIGNGNWSAVVGATNNQTAGRPVGTGVFLASRNVHGSSTVIQNLNNTYVDDAYDNTSIHYYTIYWRDKLGGGKQPIHMNRVHTSNNIAFPLPISSLILEEIYYP